MRAIPRLSPLQTLPERDWRAAVFLTFTFDPGFFETTVLPSVLPIASDPQEDADRFFSQADAAVRRVPMVVVADAAVAGRSRRLPYDLLLVRRRTFHPKVTILCGARTILVRVASGNLTAGGYGQNAELFSEIELDPTIESHHAPLVDLLDLLTEVEHDLPEVTAQWVDVRRTITAVAAPGGLHRATSSACRILYARRTTAERPARSLIDQAWELLPAAAEIRRIGVLAPFYERDAGADQDDLGLLGDLRARAGDQVPFDLGCPYDQGEPLPMCAARDHTPGWWQVRPDAGDADQRWDFLATQVVARSGRITYVHKDDVRHVISQPNFTEVAKHGRLLPLPSPELHLPAKALLDLAQTGPVALWLHPTVIHNGEKMVRHQPLHAKALALVYSDDGAIRTLILTGSANASRRAWLDSPDAGGNAEAVMATLHDGEVTIRDLDPDLTFCPLDLVQMSERTFPQRQPDPAAGVVSAILSASAAELTITWSGNRPRVPWCLRYRDAVVAESPVAPEDRTVISGFPYHPGVLTLILLVGSAAGEIPITVSDPVALPGPVPTTGLFLEDLIRMLGRSASLETLQERRRNQPPDFAAADPHLGERLRPNDIFHAWWSLAEQLADPGTTPRVTRMLLDGPTGVRRTWQAMTAGVAAGRMDAAERWLFGAELVREMRAIRLTDAPEADEQARLIACLIDDIAGACAQVVFDPAPPWLARIADFYGVAHGHG